MRWLLGVALATALWAAADPAFTEPAADDAEHFPPEADEEPFPLEAEVQLFPIDANAQLLAAAADAERFLLFSGFDLWRNGGFTYAGLLWSPGGIDREGFTLKALAGGGTYRYRFGLTEIGGTQLLTTLMPGWRFKRDGFEATVFAGLDVQQHTLNPKDPGNRLHGEHVGLRVASDIWWEPAAATMANGSATYATVGANYLIRGAFGWRLLESAYLGPEAQAFSDGSYRQLRIGLHATALKTGPLEWSAALGYLQDTDRRSGCYGRVGILMRH